MEGLGRHLEKSMGHPRGKGQRRRWGRPDKMPSEEPGQLGPPRWSTGTTVGSWSLL